MDKELSNRYTQKESRQIEMLTSEKMEFKGKNSHQNYKRYYLIVKGSLTKIYQL